MAKLRVTVISNIITKSSSIIPSEINDIKRNRIEKIMVVFHNAYFGPNLSIIKPANIGAANDASDSTTILKPIQFIPPVISNIFRDEYIKNADLNEFKMNSDTDILVASEILKFCIDKYYPY
ncbi:hypothetical protein XBKQ1_1800001 [Xenorhabdus bovienii str. kraussei Quebec]|uniref:Uncharacterized protein n=1 Tax=Xenorhabdus bovienii str. kraussei Quebec TaxID=1398203 RepID=A0A077PD15_XENBV|nr:hypothetical protein XBKQ1_1800001 [Xenorhabdus bovienii str. kraussei Quebec]